MVAMTSLATVSILVFGLFLIKPLLLVLKIKRTVLMPVPGDPTASRFNIVPRDFVVDAIAYLSGDARSKDRTYQIADPHPLTVGELLDALAEAADRIKFAKGQGLSQEAERHLATVRARVLESLEGYIRFWAHFPDIWFGGLKANTKSEPMARPGGWGFVAGLKQRVEIVFAAERKCPDAGKPRGRRTLHRSRPRGGRRRPSRGERRDCSARARSRRGRAG